MVSNTRRNSRRRRGHAVVFDGNPPGRDQPGVKSAGFEVLQMQTKS